ncbi:hypothetical protein TRAPUB_13263 [Trametes pubescens]|uniref:Uncharacterized protein n=1 Tax=Trametes pubescens TaxID=154538 RepID=A0A1M2VRG5_TRAPU|nr:hypothetical protein TRAPUB_13263 [Trametes pubescens]
MVIEGMNRGDSLMRNSTKCRYTNFFFLGAGASDHIRRRKGAHPPANAAGVITVPLCAALPSLARPPMSSKQPQLGSLAIQAPTLTPRTVHVTPSTCRDISVFKGAFRRRCSATVPPALTSGIAPCSIAPGAPDLMSQYRKLDDTINMRLNRTTAQFRDRERSGLSGKGGVEEQACIQVWRELVGASGWPSRL